MSDTNICICGSTLEIKVLKHKGKKSYYIGLSCTKCNMCVRKSIDYPTYKDANKMLHSRYFGM